MATISYKARPGDGKNHVANSLQVKVPYVIFGPVIDLAEAATLKGTALAQGDIIEAVNLPAGTMLLGGGAIKLAAMTGTSTDLTFDIGFTGNDEDNLVDGWDFDGAAVGSVATPGNQVPQIITSADTIDILFTTQTGSVTGGKVQVWAVVCDIDAPKSPGAAQLKS